MAILRKEDMMTKAPAPKAKAEKKDEPSVHDKLEKRVAKLEELARLNGWSHV